MLESHTGFGGPLRKEPIYEAAEVLRGTDGARDPAGEAGTQVGDLG